MNNFCMEFDLNNAQVDTNIDMQYYLNFVATDHKFDRR
jgi:hypothetical protein